MALRYRGAKAEAHFFAQISADGLQVADDIVVRLEEDVVSHEIVVGRLWELINVDKEGRRGGGGCWNDEVSEEDGVVGDVGAAEVESP